MSLKKQVTTHYQNVGGINEKASKYVTGLMEFLNLVNFDLNTPGAISKRPGSTQFLVSGTSGNVTNMHEFVRINGFSQIVVSANSGLFSRTAGGTLTTIETGRALNARSDMLTMNDWLWIANGQTLLKYDGANLQPFQFTTQGFFLSGPSAAGSSTGVFLAPRYMIGFVNSLGYYGGVARGLMELSNNVASGGASSVAFGLTLLASGVTAGVSYFAIYRNDDFAINGVSYFASNAVSFLKYGTFYLHSLVPSGASLFIDTAGATSLVNQPIVAKDFFSFISHTITGATTSVFRVPRFLEPHQNSMFMAGFSFTPSMVWFSEIEEPETILPDYNFPVNLDDGDKITGLKSFGNQLLVFKQYSFHRVQGDNPENYELEEISKEYGALSDSAIITIDGICYFLDQKGIVQYNGSSWQILSDRMETTFRRMNLSSAFGNATAVHYSYRNQIWFSFPVDSSTTNNMTVVYDYKAKAMFKYEGPQHASLAQMTAGLGAKYVFSGNYSGQIMNYSPSLLADNGTAFTLIAQPRFDQPQGPDNTAHFRRLWLDQDVTSGITGIISVEILRNMSQTAITTMSVYQSSFQSRLEFGVQAKAIGFIFSHRSQSLPCTINGWAVGHRVLREL